MASASHSTRDSSSSRGAGVDVGRIAAVLDRNHNAFHGEKVAFFVTAGNARNITDHSGSKVFERSNVVIVSFPTAAGSMCW